MVSSIRYAIERQILTGPYLPSIRQFFATRLVERRSALRRPSVKVRVLGLLVALAIQAGLLGLMILAVQAPKSVNAPVILVSLYQGERIQERYRPRRLAEGARPAERKPYAIAPVPQIQPTMSVPLTREAATPSETAKPEIGADVAAALRRTLSCQGSQSDRLSQADREYCERLARERGRTFENAQFGVALRDREAFDAAAKRDSWFQQPFLAEKPTKGCRPRVTEENLPVSGGGTARNWTTGVACGVPF
jgi:hypothetical protein